MGDHFNGFAIVAKGIRMAMAGKKLRLMPIVCLFTFVLCTVVGTSAESCGDGLREEGEQCDDGNLVGTRLTSCIACACAHAQRHRAAACWALTRRDGSHDFLSP